MVAFNTLSWWKERENSVISKTSRQICGTCQYWTGAREPVFDRMGEPKVDIVDLEGECQNIQCKFVDQKRKSQLKCKHYSKWTEIL